MKKYVLMLVMILACMTAFSGCSDLKIKAGIDKSSVSEEKPEKFEKSEDKDEDADDSEEVKAEREAEEVVQTEQEKQKLEEQLDEIQQEQMALEAELEQKKEQEHQEKPEDITEMSDVEQIGEELFYKACKTMWEYLIGCPYELDYEDTYENAVRVIGVDSISDILVDYNKVFTGNRPELSEKYIETQTALYCYDGGRGANIYYQSTDLELISCEDNTAVFNAVSHYADPETQESMEDKEHTFTIVRVDGEWRVSEFTLPY